jgi:hypothetical protein
MSVVARMYDQAEWPKVLEGLGSFMKNPKETDTICFTVRALLFDQRTGKDFLPLLEKQMEKVTTTWKAEEWTTLLDVVGADLQDVDRSKVVSNIPKADQKLSAKDRSKGFVRAWQELLFARSRMDMGRATLSQQAVPVPGGGEGIVRPSPDPTNNRRQPAVSPGKQEKKPQKPEETKKPSKSKRARHHDTDDESEDSQEESAEAPEENGTDPENRKAQVIAMNRVKVNGLSQFLDCFHKRKEEEAANTPFAIALNEIWKVDKRATDQSKMILSDPMRLIMRDRDAALGLHPFWDGLIQTSRTAVHALQALHAKYGSQLHWKMATVGLPTDEENLLLEWASFLAAVEMCKAVPVTETSQEVKGWLMEVRVATFQYMFDFATKGNFRLAWKLPPPPNSIAARLGLQNTQPSPGTETGPQVVQQAPIVFQQQPVPVPQGVQVTQPQPQVVLQPVQYTIPAGQGNNRRPQQPRPLRVRPPMQVFNSQFQHYTARPAQHPPQSQQGPKQGANYYR